jgi:hypothetical protein
MKLCHYNEHEAGVIADGRVYPIGPALIAEGLARKGYTMQEIVDALANQPAAMTVARKAASGKSLAREHIRFLSSVLTVEAEK